MLWRDYKNETAIECNVLLIYSLYMIAMLVVSLVLQWGYRINIVLIAGVVVCWSLFIRRYRDYPFRAMVTSLIVLLDFIIYGCQAESFFGILATMSALVVLLALYQIKEIMYLLFGSSLCLLFYHLCIVNTIRIPKDNRELARMILQLCSIFTVECVAYYLVKMQISINERLQETIEELQLAENSKSDFLANVSHEIRTPVNAVCGISEMMLMEDLTPKLKENVHDIQMAGRNLHRIISDLLDFTELQSGEFTLIEEPYNITSTVNDVMNMTMAQIENKNIDFVVDCNAQIPRSLVGDEQKIRRVMVNVLNNAVKFTTEGCIRLTISYRRESYGINLIVSIKDSGIGIKEENLEKIFTDFNQVDTKKNRQEGGVGLGLAISKALIQKMGGFIKIESEWEKGTKVQFVIPQKVLDAHPIIEVDQPKKKRILGYVNLEKYKYGLTRDSYAEMLMHMSQQLQLPYQPCRNIGELKRRIKKEMYTHLFMGWEEYLEEPEFYEAIADRMPTFLIVDRYVMEKNMEIVSKSKLYRIIKPFYALSIATALNGDSSLLRMNDNGKRVRFIAPEASVLVVDDSLMNLKVVEGLLRPYQIKVFTAESGAEALKKIERCDFDFVFMDHMMPEMDGVETLHKIRGKLSSYFKTVPIIALTANAVGGAREMFLEEGFQDFVSKPIELPVLERVLKKYIPDNKKIYDFQEEIMQKEDALKEEVIVAEQNLDEIDIEMGVEYLGGSMSDYLDIVKVYCKTGREKITEIQKYYEAWDWQNYTILVHAVKSTSLGIGAERLSELAKALEEAGREGNSEYILRHHEEMYALYQKVITEAEEKILKEKPIENLSDDSGVEEDLTAPEDGLENARQEITTEQLEKIITKLSQALTSFEAELVEPVLEELGKYQYNTMQLNEVADQIKEKVDSFDFIGAEEDVKQLQEKMR